MDNPQMVIDTGVFIAYLRSSKKSSTILYNLPEDSSIYISSVSVYELYMGATSAEKHGHVSSLIEHVPVLPFTDSIAQQAAAIYHDLRKKNQMIEFRDIFIGATALYNDLPLKTLNSKHFDRITGLKLV